MAEARYEEVATAAAEKEALAEEAAAEAAARVVAELAAVRAAEVEAATQQAAMERRRVEAAAQATKDAKRHVLERRAAQAAAKATHAVANAGAALLDAEVRRAIYSQAACAELQSTGTPVSADVAQADAVTAVEGTAEATKAAHAGRTTVAHTSASMALVSSRSHACRERAAIHIQACYRRRLVRLTMTALTHLATQIQANYRGSIGRKQALVQRRQAVKPPGFLQGYSVQQDDGRLLRLRTSDEAWGTHTNLGGMQQAHHQQMQPQRQHHQQQEQRQPLKKRRPKQRR